MAARRSRAREVALQLLFQWDQNPTPVPRSAIEQFARDRLLADDAMTIYCLRLYDGSLAHRSEIDATLSATATNWRLSRMQPGDRNVLRLGAYELLHDPSSPPLEVVINEAVELSRRFGSEDSPAFVNGVLDKVSKMRNENTTEPTPPTESAPPAEPTS